MTEALRGKKGLPKYIHAVITLALMFIIGKIPPIGFLTPYGMQILGILAGVVYGMSTVDVFWPAMCALLGLGLVNGGLESVIASALGTDLVWGMIMIFIVLYSMANENVTGFFANWIISRKILKGRPWLFSFFILLGVSIVSIISPEAAMLLFWEIIYSTCDSFDMKRNSRWSIAMIFGTCLASGMGILYLPVMRNGLIVAKLFTATTSQSFNAIQYILAMVPLGIASLGIFILLCKYLFRIDIGNLKEINDSIVDKEALRLNSRQKFVMISVVIMILLLLVPSILPKSILDSFIIFKIFTLFGLSSVLILLFCIVRIDGRPIIKIQEAASKGVVWPMVIMVALIMPIGSALTSPNAGITDFIRSGLGPLLEGSSPWVFVALLVILSAILTNFAQNLVIMSLMLPIMYAMAADGSINMFSVTIMLALGTHYAVILPSASPSAGMMFSNENFPPKFVYKNGLITMIICLAFVLTLGFLWTNLIFGF